MSAILIGNLKL